MITHYTPGQQIHYTNPNVRSVGPRSLGPNVIIRDEFTGVDGTLLTAHAISPINIPIWSCPTILWKKYIRKGLVIKLSNVSPGPNSKIISLIFFRNEDKSYFFPVALCLFLLLVTSLMIVYP